MKGAAVNNAAFSADKTVFYWKKMPFRTFTAREKSVHVFKASKDRLMLLLQTSTSDDCKQKPVFIFHSEIVKTVKNYFKCTLSMLWKWNNKGWKTAHLFITWFTE